MDYTDEVAQHATERLWHADSMVVRDDGRYAAEVDGRVIDSISFGAPRPAPCKEAS